MSLKFQDIQRNVSDIANRQTYTLDVLYELMAAYGRSASSITKLRGGVINLAQNKETTVLQRGVVYFKNVIKSASLPAEVERLEQDPLTARYNPRFLIATDLTSFAAKDTKKGNTLEIKWEDIDRNVDFFYGWTGDEVVDEKTEAAADRRAADKMKELYFEVEKVNSDRLAEKNSNFRHELNVFFTRLLFCFFAEDTRVFSNEDKGMFTSSIRDFTQPDGSDLEQFLGTLFDALDTKDKSEYSSPFSNFPYVNGSLFDKTKGITIPKFNAQARKLILDCRALSWAEINPDIFGSMFQSIVDESQRDTHGMHYTSVPNIMKTIEPLFLDELREEFDKNYENDKKLQQLWDRISKIKVFDPACGSGNFLIIAYKELRKLEHAIIDRVFEEDYKKAALAGKLTSRIDLNNFYGIEIDDFACEVAVLSLYIAKHQMNIEFEKQFGKKIELIPLNDKANIVKANAARIDWQDVCPNKPRSASTINIKQTKLIPDEYEQEELIKDYGKGDMKWDEIYLISNPPYAGFKMQTPDQKEDMKEVFGYRNDYKKMDYISCWFHKATQYIRNSNGAYAFVATNSINQGEHVGLLWPEILTDSLEIGFAHQSFKWTNNAKNNAGVTCVVVGVRNKSSKPRMLFSGNLVQVAKNINAYLVDGPDIIVHKSSSPLSSLPRMTLGNMPKDDGNFLLSKSEMEDLIEKDPLAKDFIRPVVGAKEFLNGLDKWCIWITPEMYKTAYSINLLKSRIDKVKEFRLESTDKSANDMANTPYMFREQKIAKEYSIFIPTVTSERRQYIPMGILDKGTVVVAPNNVIYDPEIYVFGLISSRMHMVWAKAVAGQLETRIRYSSAIVYNNFPVIALTEKQKSEIGNSAREILFTREVHSEKTLAELYDPDKMPEDLLDVHHHNDILVDRLYRQKPFENDEERLAELFTLYEQMTAQEN